MALQPLEAFFYFAFFQIIIQHLVIINFVCETFGNIAKCLCLRLGESPAFKDLLGDRIGPTDADLESDDTLDAWLMREATTGQHISGTCKMGPSSDPLAVVDQHGRVYGLEGLRVVDASIMPDCIRANTNVTTMMIGERVADFILQGG